MITVATCLWDKNKYTNSLSGTFNELWVERLYFSVSKHLTMPFQFKVFTERPRNFWSPIWQERLKAPVPGYGSFTEPYRLDEPMILVGLDTIFVRNINHLAEWCLTGDKIALIRDTKSVRLKHQGYPYQAINGVALVPAGWRKVYDEWHGANDMEHIRRYPWECIDDRWPGQVLSYKMGIRPLGNVVPPECRIVYFHGQPKADTLTDLPWVREHWLECQTH